MSNYSVLLKIEPPVRGDSEVLSPQAAACPDCAGQGSRDMSGYMAKFKEADAPDVHTCKRCNGTGKLTAKVVIKWEAARVGK